MISPMCTEYDTESYALGMAFIGNISVVASLTILL